MRADAVAGASGKEEVAVKPSQCNVKAESDITFHATSKVDKAGVIFLADTPDNSCESPTPGNSPEKGGNPILVFPIYNGFVQPVSIKVNSDNKHFRSCVELGLDPMPNPAIIIKE